MWQIIPKLWQNQRRERGIFVIVCGIWRGLFKNSKFPYIWPIHFESHHHSFLFWASWRNLVFSFIYYIRYIKEVVLFWNTSRHPVLRVNFSLVFFGKLGGFLDHEGVSHRLDFNTGDAGIEGLWLLCTQWTTFTPLCQFILKNFNLKKNYFAQKPYLEGPGSL